MKKLSPVKKLFIAAIFILVISVPVRATVGPLTGELAVVVDGETFYVWGVFMDYSTSRFRLRDMAYVLNGTPAQFNIRETDDERFDYWIVRGEPHTPTGDELRPIDAAECCCGDGIGWFSGYFYSISAVIGLDGTSAETDAPASAVALIAAVCDGGEFFICVFELARLLGFSVDWSRHMYFWVQAFDFYIEDADYVISATGEPAALPDKPIEFLQLMLDLSGHWVDVAHFESPVIDESIVWPTELHFHERGAGVSNFHWSNTFAPLNRGEAVWEAVSFRELGDGFVEITITDSRHVVVDMSRRVYELTYYIENVPHHMVRRTDQARRRFYQIEPAEGGGVRLRYLLGRTFWAGEGFTIYRSQSRGVIGVPVYVRERVPRHHDVEFIDSWRYDNRVLFEFTDPDVNFGVHYYTFSTNMWSNENIIKYGGEPWQIRVDACELLRSEESTSMSETSGEEISETPEPETEESSGGSDFLMSLLRSLLQRLRRFSPIRHFGL
ncbi:MAG: hypothetical protein FWC70_11205 [Defluviitaleaceae bacterium]|nr:hypothetical protein [Defluviitaleaceae bacterium]